MESCGQPGRIHVSEETAKELVQRGKTNWLTRREDQIVAKGKGKLTTYWLTPAGTTGTTSSACESDCKESQTMIETMQTLRDVPTGVTEDKTVDNERTKMECQQLKQSRLIDWNTDLLLGQLKRVVARRNVLQFHVDDPDALDDLARSLSKEAMAVDAVQEIIEMPSHMFDGSCHTYDIDLGFDVQSELRDYVSRIASMYSEENPFHNFVSRLLNC